MCRRVGKAKNEIRRFLHEDCARQVQVSLFNVAVCTVCVHCTYSYVRVPQRFNYKGHCHGDGASTLPTCVRTYYLRGTFILLKKQKKSHSHYAYM